jgi:hypothetical protein
VKHLKTLNQIFLDSSNFSERIDWQIHNDNYRKLSEIISSPDIELFNQLYSADDRQMILADIIEYIFFARGYYAITSGCPEAKKQKKQQFIRMILHFVNILMDYEAMTVDEKLRKAFLKKLRENVPIVKKEELFDTLAALKGTVGLPLGESAQEEVKKLNKYFDKMLPKTAGGLWHELLVFVFLIRHNLGFIVPLVLNQRLLSGTGTLVPPDFLIIAKDKHIYGIEVGTKKEIQSGSFSLSTNIPTATIDTENSRSSDRCPICKRWIPFCDKVINEFSDIDKQIPLSPKVNCLEECKIHSKEDISKGKCPYTKYARSEAKSLKYTHIKYADGLHYHYRCVLSKLSPSKQKLLIKAKDTTALKTHYPYYSGLESLLAAP